MEQLLCLIVEAAMEVGRLLFKQASADTFRPLVISNLFSIKKPYSTLPYVDIRLYNTNHKVIDE